MVASVMELLSIIFLVVGFLMISVSVATVLGKVLSTMKLEEEKDREEKE